ncbi:GCN5-related N-acetyltransferase [Cladochytrium replicatum]|nr:GCN5-related N-acetyltransferase [Cladochytrium replicatum]
MSDIVIVQYIGLPEEAKLIRNAVFQDEQKIPHEYEFDEYDPICHQWVVFVSGAPAGTARLIVKPDNETGKIGRVAVLQDYRRVGIGGKLIAQIEEFATNTLGLSKLELSAQATKRGWYEGRGYEAVGEPYIEDGLLHLQMMKKSLRNS